MTWFHSIKKYNVTGTSENPKKSHAHNYICNTGNLGRYFRRKISCGVVFSDVVFSFFF